jgi:hypothetical protein
MRSKERVIAALEHREPDRVPIGEMAIDFELTEIALGRPTLYPPAVADCRGSRWDPATGRRSRQRGRPRARRRTGD